MSAFDGDAHAAGGAGEDAGGLTRIRVGHSEIRVEAARLAAGTRLRVQLLARDVIVSTRAPQYLSVRNSLQGIVTAVEEDGSGADGGSSDLVSIDIGAGAAILARVTRAARRELGLATGVPAWALVKAVSLRGHSFPAPRAPSEPGATPARDAAT